MKTLCGVVITLLFLVGCGGAADTPTATEAGPTTETAAAQPLDLAGTWKQTNSNSPDAWQEALIEGEVIEVYWVFDNGDTRSLYWAGTFVAPTEPGTSYEWDSENDHSKTDTAILAATGDTKTFSFLDGELSWEASMLGTTTRIRTERA